MSDSLAKAAELAYDLMATIDLEGAHFRSDIGEKAL
jgi:phosphoribosylamine-glycine ligase